jgi:RHS repeat-associated protein
MEMPGRKYNPQGYRYGFNGKENDRSGEWGLGLVQDYGFRLYNPGLGRFLSVDPLTESYPWNSTYAFAENRPIDGIDLEGREWDYAMIPQLTGNTKIKITVNLELSLDYQTKLTLGRDIEKYKEAISDQFNRTLQKSSNGEYLGAVTFGPSLNKKQLTPSLSINGKEREPVGDDELSEAGNAIGASISVNLRNKKNNIQSPEDFALSVVHELFHTIRIEHPTEKTQAKDLELLKDRFYDPKNPRFYSTPNTDPNIHLNIMIYGFKIVDGKSCSESCNGQTADFLTKGQLMLIIPEINLQKKGSGSDGMNDSYWEEDNIPGYNLEECR